MQAHVKCCPSRVGICAWMCACTTAPLCITAQPACSATTQGRLEFRDATSSKPGEAVRAAAVAASHPHLEISGGCGAGDCGGDGCAAAHDGTMMLATDVLVLLRRHAWRTGSSSASQLHRC
jgi:hypothetical protein